MGSWLLVDCAQRTSAILVEEREGRHRIVARGDARTTLNPEGDVLLGVVAAVRQIEERCGRVLLSTAGGELKLSGVDDLLVTSSLGGGLQMMVAGLVKIMTAESAERAALGAGANVLDVIAIDDGRLPHERIERMRELRPDIFLLSGGVDKGNQSDVLEFARELAQAGLPEIPVIYAGNKDATAEVKRILAEVKHLPVVENLRPVLEDEVLEPTRQKIQELYMQHVVSNAPGFAQLRSLSRHPIVPSTGATSRLTELVAKLGQQDLLVVSVGDATTDVFSVFSERFTRTVSANLGLGHGIANVAVKAGLPRLQRWIPDGISAEQLMDQVYNLMLTPEEQPTTPLNQAIQRAAIREAIRQAFTEHRVRATGLRGIHHERDISTIFNQIPTSESLVDLQRLELIIGSSQLFCWADEITSATILLDALAPQGVTKLAVDRWLAAPQLGALASIAAEVGYQAFTSDGLLQLGVAVCPLPTGRPAAGAACLTARISTPGQRATLRDFAYGQLVFQPLAAGTEVLLTPAAGFNLGLGPGRPRSLTMGETACGLIVDAREQAQR